MTRKSIACAMFLAVIAWASLGDAAGEEETGSIASASKQDNPRNERVRLPRLELSRQRELSRETSADRPLSLEDLRLLLDLSEFLLDKEQDWGARERVAHDLGYLGHKYAIPALLATIRDETNPPGLRQRSVIALSRIPDKQVVDYLIDVLDEPPSMGSREPYIDLRVTAADQLHRITGRPWGSGIKTRRREWRKWWLRNRDRVTLNRDMAFES